jgi:hypothetical protein
VSDSFNEYDKAAKSGPKREYVPAGSAMDGLQADLDAEIREKQMQIDIAKLRAEYQSKLDGMQSELDSERRGGHGDAPPPTETPHFPNLHGMSWQPTDRAPRQQRYETKSPAEVNWWILLVTILTLLLVIYLVLAPSFSFSLPRAEPATESNAVIENDSQVQVAGAKLKKLEGANRWLRHLNKREREKSAILQQHNEIYTAQIKKNSPPPKYSIPSDPDCAKKLQNRYKRKP